MPSDAVPPPRPPVTPPPPAVSASPATAAPVVRAPTRLHPFSMLRGIPLRAVIQAVVPLSFAGFQVRPLLDEVGAGAVVPLTVLGALLVVLAVAAVRFVAWQRHTYELTGEAVIERRGIVNLRERTVQLARLQQVEVEQTILDRLAGTAVLRLETASDASEVELELVVVGLVEARELRASLLPNEATVEEREAARELVHVPLHHVALASLTGRQLLVIPLTFAAAIGFFAENDLLSDATDVAAGFLVGVGVIAAALLISLVVLLSVVVALVTGVLRDGDFRIREVGDDLHVSRGLLGRREAVLPRSRLQKVSIRHGWLRRHLGFASMTLHSAGGGSGAGEAGALNERELHVPLVRTERARRLLLELLPDAGALPELVPHPPRARRRARVRFLLTLIGLVPLAVTPVRLLTESWTVTAIAVLGVAGLVLWLAWTLGAKDHANRGSAVGDRWVVARSGALMVVESVAPRAKAQGVRVTSNPFQRRHDLATMTVQVAGPGGATEILDIDAAAAETWSRELVDRWRVTA